MKITVEFDSLNEFKAHMDRGVVGVVVADGVPEAMKDVINAAKKEEGFPPDQMQAGPNPFIKEEAVPFAEDPKPEPKPQPEPVAEAKSVSMDEVTALCMKLMDAGKQDGLIALLQQFGVNALPELKPAQLDQFYAQALKMEG